MSIDESSIIAAVGSLPLLGNEEGLMPAFGLYLTRHYAEYYNRASFAYLLEAERMGGESADRARVALTEAGHVCAFNTFGGIMISQEWEAVVAPMIESRDDWVRGIVSVVNALGWGRWRVDTLSNDELRVSIENTYEADGYLALHGARTNPAGVCFLATGGVAGIMNLIHFGDITSKPALTPTYYREIFEGDRRFFATETACRASGAPRCEFVARRRS